MFCLAIHNTDNMLAGKAYRIKERNLDLLNIGNDTWVSEHEVLIFNDTKIINMIEALHGTINRR